MSMKANALKIESPLLDELNRIRPKEKSLAAFVRETLQKEVLRQKMGQAAERYVKFLEGHAKERDWLSEWERVDLGEPPAPRKGKRS